MQRTGTIPDKELGISHHSRQLINGQMGKGDDVAVVGEGWTSE
jgi:hypothetical protein